MHYTASFGASCHCFCAGNGGGEMRLVHENSTNEFRWLVCKLKPNLAAKRAFFQATNNTRSLYNLYTSKTLLALMLVEGYIDYCF